jgi:hypothetical protein
MGAVVGRRLTKKPLKNPIKISNRLKACTKGDFFDPQIRVME